jgi:trigger factor
MQSETEESGKETLGTRSEVEVLEGCKRRLKASVPVEKVREELDKNYRQLTQSVQLPGFRKGKVPRKLLEARYGEEIEGDVKEALLSVSLAEVVEEKDLKVIGSPRFDNIQFDKDSDLSYEVEFEVRPEFEVPSLDGFEGRAEPVPVTEDKVDERIELFRRNEARFAPIDSAQAGPDDLHTGKYQLFREEEKVKPSEDVAFTPSRKIIAGFTIDDLPERCASWDRSTPLVIDGIRVPDDFPDEVLRGTQVRLEFLLDDARRIELADLETVAKALGLSGGADELRKTMREELEKESQRTADAELDQKILDALLEKTPMDLPEGLLEAQKKRWRLEREYKLLEEKVPKEEIAALVEKEGETAAEDLKRGLKTFFIFEKVAESEKVFVTEREVDVRVERFAGLYGLPPDRVREELRKTGRLDEIRSMIRHEKVRLLLRKAVTLAPEAVIPAPEPSAPESPGATSSGASGATAPEPSAPESSAPESPGAIASGATAPSEGSPNVNEEAAAERLAEPDPSR